MRPKLSWLVAGMLAIVAAASASPGGSTEARETSERELRKASLLLARATYGARTGDLEALLSKGSEAWLEEQLHPQRIADPVVTSKLEGFDQLELSTSELMKKYPRPSPEQRQRMQRARRSGERAAEEGPHTVLRDLAHAKLVRAVHSERQLHEVMTDFWFNHFNVYARKNRNTLLAMPSYERDAIRPHALGRFQDLLLATARHPAMLFYLDNWLNTKEGFDPARALRAEMDGSRGRRGVGREREREPRELGLNENYARELLELHTLGVDGGYGQDDVVEVARAMTGWSVVGPGVARVRQRLDRRGRARIPELIRSMPEEGSYFFNALAHDDAPKLVVGVKLVPTGNGIDDGLAVIELLSRHPSTARFVSSKLAQRFVSDSPSEDLVSEMSKTFLDTDGDISAVLRTMFHSPRFVDEAAADVHGKVKTPLELVASAARSTGASVDGRGLAHFVGELGMPLYQCQPPTGYDESAASWLSAGSVLTRIRFAGAFASGSIPGVRFDAALQNAGELASFLASPSFQRQ